MNTATLTRPKQVPPGTGIRQSDWERMSAYQQGRVMDRIAKARQAAEAAAAPVEDRSGEEWLRMAIADREAADAELVAARAHQHGADKVLAERTKTAARATAHAEAMRDRSKAAAKRVAKCRERVVLATEVREESVIARAAAKRVAKIAGDEAGRREAYLAAQRVAVRSYERLRLARAAVQVAVGKAAKQDELVDTVERVLAAATEQVTAAKAECERADERMRAARSAAAAAAKAEKRAGRAVNVSVYNAVYEIPPPLPLSDEAREAFREQCRLISEMLADLDARPRGKSKAGGQVAA